MVVSCVRVCVVVVGVMFGWCVGGRFRVCCVLATRVADGTSNPSHLSKSLELVLLSFRNWIANSVVAPSPDNARNLTKTHRHVARWRSKGGEGDGGGEHGDGQMSSAPMSFAVHRPLSIDRSPHLSLPAEGLRMCRGKGGCGW